MIRMREWWRNLDGDLAICRLVAIGSCYVAIWAPTGEPRQLTAAICGSIFGVAVMILKRLPPIREPEEDGQPW